MLRRADARAGCGVAERSPKRTRNEFSEIYLSPDAFARHTSESTIAEQLGDVLAANGLPRPAPADDDRVGGWMLIYQMLQNGQWLIAGQLRAADRVPANAGARSGERGRRAENGRGRSRGQRAIRAEVAAWVRDARLSSSAWPNG